MSGVGSSDIRIELRWGEVVGGDFHYPNIGIILISFEHKKELFLKGLIILSMMKLLVNLENGCFSEF